MEEMNTRPDREVEPKWYVVHTYSGHENKVKATMESMVKNREMDDLIFEIEVPMEEVVEVKDGVAKTKERKLFPSYVLVKMIMTDESWYLVRNTRGVTGFVGPGSKPVPLSDEEVRALGVVEAQEIFGDYEVGEVVRVISGPFADMFGTVTEVDYDKGKVKLTLSMFNRDMDVELEFSQITKA